MNKFFVGQKKIITAYKTSNTHTVIIDLPMLCCDEQSNCD